MGSIFITQHNPTCHFLNTTGVEGMMGWARLGWITQPKSTLSGLICTPDPTQPIDEKGGKTFYQ